MIKITEELFRIILSVVVSVLTPVSVDIKDNQFIEEEPIMILDIEKIGVHNKIYSKDSSLNNIDINIMLLEESDYPDTEGGVVLLGGHSGRGTAAYLQRLVELEIGDTIRINYKGDDYLYTINNISKDNKDGKIRVDYSIKRNRLVIYTCYPGDKSSYLVLSSNR